MATTPTRNGGKSPSIPLDSQLHQPELRTSKDPAQEQQPTSPSSSEKQRKALSQITTPPRRIIVESGSSSSGSSSQQQLQLLLEGEDAVTSEGKDSAGETTTGLSTDVTAAAVEIGEEEEEESTVTDSPFLVFSPGMINVRRQGGEYRDLGLNCSTPTRPKHGGANNWIGDLFSRGRVTRSRRRQDDELVELDHNNVTREELEDAEEEEEDDDDVEDASRSGGRSGRSPVTPRSQFGRWKFDIMMSQSTMKPPKLNGDDATAVEEEHDKDEGDEDGEGDLSDDTQWPFGNNHIESDPSTPKRRPSKIPRGRSKSPTSPTFRDSGCDDKEADEADEEETEDEGVGSDQDGDAPKDDSGILDSFSNSQQDQLVGCESNGSGSSSSSSNGSGTMKPPKLNLRHLGGLPSSPSEGSSASFHTPPRKRTRKDLDDGYGFPCPPPAPKLISPEHVLQFFPTHSQSPSVLKSLQLRRAASALDGSFNYTSSER
ncbi:hypothetical protein BGZ47_010979 [Haplosporangium gracile]|nr:hypothetical protein BGZ47_010979 [Haplosporangium gracile]